MTANNLAIVFGPTIMQPKNNNLEAVMDIPYVTGAVKSIIENFVSIFPAET